MAKGKAPKSPEDSKQEAKEDAEAAKEEIAEAKKSAENAVAKNPTPTQSQLNLWVLPQAKLNQCMKKQFKISTIKSLYSLKKKEALKKQKSSVKVQAKK